MTGSLRRHSILVSLTVLTSQGSTAQDFAPFSPSSRKLFANADHDQVFSLVFDSVASNSDTASFYNFHTKRDVLLPSNCGWWTGQECWPMDAPTWAGAEIKVAPNGTHVFHSAFVGDAPITLAFSTVPGSETFMAEAIDQEFLMAYDGTFTLDILGQTEVVRQWTILHQDQFGNAIASPLNGAHIRVGENLGLIDFFRVDSFPLILEPIELVGQASPALGLFEITPAVLEDHQPGDEVQFHETHDLYIGPPWADYDRYRKYVYLTREETPSAVVYTVRQEVFDAGGTEVTVDTITLQADRTTLLGAIPFERFNGAWPHLREGDYCGTPMWAFTQPLHNGIDYCADENCYGGTDTGGPPVEGATTYVVGLGVMDLVEYVYSPYGYTTHHTIVYFKKNGTECFQEVMTGSGQTGAVQRTFQLAPNPTTGVLHISSNRPVESVEVIDVQGHLITTAALDPSRSQLGLGASAEGLYLVRLHFIDGGFATQRVLLRR